MSSIKQSRKVSTKALGKGAGQQEAQASGELQEGQSQGQSSQTPTWSGSELRPRGPRLPPSQLQPREAYGRDKGPWGLRWSEPGVHSTSIPQSRSGSGAGGPLHLLTVS